MNQLITIRNSSFHLLICLVFTGCVNLSGVNEYAKNAHSTLQSYHGIGIRFEQICEENCHYELMTGRLEEMAVSKNKIKPLSWENTCDCEAYINADQALDQFLFVVTQYLEGLEKVSTSEPFAFHKIAEKELQETSGLLKLKPEEVMGYAHLVEVAGQMAVDIKRRKALKEIIVNSNPAFQALMNRLKFAANGPLKMALVTQHDLSYNYYKMLLFQKAGFTLKEKADIDREYIKKRDQIEVKVNALLEFERLLETVQQGHQLLATHPESIDRDELNQELAIYITAIKQLNANFKIVPYE